MGRLTAFTFACSDGVDRTWYAESYPAALKLARDWCLARNLEVSEG
jgi:hypothetical protein